MMTGFIIGIFTGYLFAYIQVALDNEKDNDQYLCTDGDFNTGSGMCRVPYCNRRLRRGWSLAYLFHDHDVGRSV